MAIGNFEIHRVSPNRPVTLTGRFKSGFEESSIERSADSILIVYSRTDPASKNIAQQLIEHHSLVRDQTGSEIYRKDNVRLVSLDKLCIYAALGELPSDIDSIIFASKHVSSTGKPALTVHATGNLTTAADFGGNPEEVSFVDPATVRTALRVLRDGASKNELDIDVTMEATHHGPTSFPCPACFVEIGSGPMSGTTRCLAG